MPPQRGARPPSTNDNLQGNAALPYQNPRQSGRTRRHSTKALDHLQQYGPFATPIQPTTIDPSSKCNSEQTQDTEMTSHTSPPQLLELTNNRTINEIYIPQTPYKIPAFKKRILDLSPPPTAQATSTLLQGDTPPPAPPALEAPCDLRQMPPSSGPADPHPATTLPTYSLSLALENTVRAAASQVAEGQQIYGPIATIWDNYLQTEDIRKLPTRLRKPLAALCKEIATVANKHFDAYIKGTHPPRPTTSPPTLATPRMLTPPEDLNTLPLATTPQILPTYAQVAGPNNPTETASQVNKQAHKPPQTKRDTQPHLDTRLFVRMGLEHKACLAGPFAILSAIKNLLGNDSTLLKEVQEVNSGFALCTDSISALTALEKYSERIALLSDCIVERQPLWTTYYLSNIPRKVNTLGSHGQIVNNLVTGTLVSEAILNLTGQIPTRTTETKESSHSELFETSWLLSFDTAIHKPLPRTVRILGVSAITSLLKHKTKTIQCSKCYRWHNSHCYTRAQRCRICGSGTHPEARHTTRCSTASPHTCLARCLHCCGPTQRTT